MLYECTDCSHCADFHDGFRVVCLHPELPPDEVWQYFPVGDRDAQRCLEFDEGQAKWFTWDNLKEAEDYAREHYPEDDDDWWAKGVAEWVRKQES